MFNVRLFAKLWIIVLFYVYNLYAPKSYSKVVD